MYGLHTINLQEGNMSEKVQVAINLKAVVNYPYTIHERITRELKLPVYHFQ